jgi:hypothetical protein
MPDPFGTIADTARAGTAYGCQAAETDKFADARASRPELSAPTKRAKRDLPDRAWRFGPTEALSGRGDHTLPAGHSQIAGRNRLAQSGSRMRRHRWLQANDLPTPVASTSAVGADKRQGSFRKDLPRPLCRPGGLKVTRLPGIPSQLQFIEVGSLPE